MTNINKPFLVFGMPRTGTSLLMSIIRSYSIEPFNISEYFSARNTIIDDNIKLKHQHKNKADVYRSLDNKEINQRIEKLKKYKDKKIAIKITSTQINDIIFEYVKNEYQCILIKRNSYEQLLSWLLSIHTGVWTIYDDKINPYEDKSLRFIVDLTHLNYFVQMKNVYQEWEIKFLKENIVTCELHYEDFNEKNNFELIVKKIGLTFNNNTILNIPKKLYTLNEKESMIVNLDEVKEYMSRIDNEIFK